jgi:predicted dehydrogenase
MAAFADPSQAALKELRGIPEFREVPAFLDYRDLLETTELDAVVISAPISLHHEMTLAALRRDIFVFLEKPPVPLLSQLEDLIAADRNGRVMVAFQNIYSDLIGDLKTALVEGRIGRILSLSVHGLWPRPTAYYDRTPWSGQVTWGGQPVLDGPCTNGMAHFVNLALYLAGTDAGAPAFPLHVAGGAYRARPDLPSYDTGCLGGQLDCGAKFFMGLSHASQALVPVEIHLKGTEGTVHLIQDCRAILREDGSIIAGNDGSRNLRRAFLRFVHGEAAQNLTPLSSMRPYVLTTELMLLSSGGIHTIPEEFLSRVETAQHGAVYDVSGIAGLFERCAREVSLPTESEAGWFRKTRPVSATEASEAEIISNLLCRSAAEQTA